MEDARRLLSMASGGRVHIANEKVECGEDGGADHVRTVKELADEGGERESLNIKGGVEVGGRRMFHGHSSGRGMAPTHPEASDE